MKQKSIYSRILILWLGLLTLAFVGCTPASKQEVDDLNRKAYDWHYRNLDSVAVFARRALALSDDYSSGKAEALNNLAFAYIGRMEYDQASRLLKQVRKEADNQVELLIADIQMMRLCQRRSYNKDFYDYQLSASRRIHRIEEEASLLDAHQQCRMIYARTEFDIVASTYFYYVGLTKQSVDALADIDPQGDIERDTAQTLNYLYNVGSGGIISGKTRKEVLQTEFDYLIRCYQMSIDHGYVYWEANSMQSLSEHLENAADRDWLIRNNRAAIAFLNVDNLPDSLLAGNLALRSLNLFRKMGDVYQTAGSYRTLAECYWEARDYRSALSCLQNALNDDPRIQRAPDLVASIREQLSLAYSAINDKPASDYNRNIYLDIQEKTRQDRQLEARAAQLNASSSQLNIMIVAVMLTIVLVVVLLLFFVHLRKKTDRQHPISSLLEPLHRWKTENDRQLQEHKEHCTEIDEQRQIVESHVAENRRRNLEQRAKVALVNSIMPFIDRMVNETDHLCANHDDPELRRERYLYIGELADKINEYNAILTQWIHMRQGQLSLKIESFPLQPLFDLVKKGSMAFRLKGILLTVDATPAVVKADRTLTLFMINTLSDNARKFTPVGGSVHISAEEKEDYVEIAVADSGMGMTEEQQVHLFDHKPIVDDSASDGSAVEGHHGFGLMNCKGIIEKYRKMSQIFAVCCIGVESAPGHGSRFYFRLPKGLRKMRTFMVALTCMLGFGANAAPVHPLLSKAGAFADSAYFCNVNGRYLRTLDFADSCRHYLNAFYVSQNPSHRRLMVAESTSTETPAEIVWLRSGLKTRYNVILDIRNESAVAALALHRWSLYTYNNQVYTQLFRELSADSSLGTYVGMMQKSESNKNVAIIILVLMLALIFPAFYLLYYRHRLFYQFSVDRIGSINKVLLSEASAQDKLQRINKLWTGNGRSGYPQFAQLDSIVSEIKAALQESIDASKQQALDIELAEDALSRANFENARLHISNSVLDNCLSTLKHETMYYPSRIKQLIDGTDDNVAALAELVHYYKDLYSLLSAQAMRQVKIMPRTDPATVSYMLELLCRLNGGRKPTLTEVDGGGCYVRLSFTMDSLQLTPQQRQALFTPETVDIQCLLLKQLVREMGEVTNARGCGIDAVADEAGHTIIEIIITKQIWTSLK